ncbi:MAG: hypothetical protein F6J93_06145 [Oscillatoria sp. SIO1A7]|nr:hypothetical protein [Oscillatoria sp. SIO1A7]
MGQAGRPSYGSLNDLFGERRDARPTQGSIICLESSDRGFELIPFLYEDATNKDFIHGSATVRAELVEAQSEVWASTLRPAQDSARTVDLLHLNTEMVLSCRAFKLGTGFGPTNEG